MNSVKFRHWSWVWDAQSVEEHKNGFNLQSSFILSGQNFPSSLAVCLFVGVCLSISEPQCWAGPGRRGFSDGVGGLCFAAQGSKSCLSVLSSWTSCNNTNGPLNRLLCCAALAWVTSHTRTLARSELSTCDWADWQPRARKFIPKVRVCFLVSAGGRPDMHARGVKQCTPDCSWVISLLWFLPNCDWSSKSLPSLFLSVCLSVSSVCLFVC